MARFMIEVEDGMSKEMEAKVLDKLYEAFAGTDTYLEQLFTAPFVSWVNTKIRDDIFPEVMQYVHQDRYNGEIDRLAKLVDDAEITNQANINLIHRLERDVDGLTKENQQYEAAIPDYDSEIAEKRGIIDGLEQEIVELKAKLYDEMTKEK
jgi:polyhydroxyalkanoate synthesis regulator phasin